uniref:Uncharacterized protein n=1 Tax=Anguilla anguilla TaxID=7936 RepID=A0A0E9XL57_ANGAN
MTHRVSRTLQWHPKTRGTVPKPRCRNCL